MNKDQHIDKIQMKNRLKSHIELADYLSAWRKNNPKTFRIDGHNAIGPANPAQWIFFEIQDFKNSDFQGIEVNRLIDGTFWNGVYYLTASTQGQAIDYFLGLVKEKKGASEIFKLTYTKDKEGIPGKRKILFKDASEVINNGWFCKQYFDKYKKLDLI